MSRQKTAPDSNKVISKRILVSVKRDQTADTPVVIWHHELPILNEIHGEGNVRVMTPEVLDDGYSGKVSPALLPFNKQQDVPQRPSDTAGIGFVFTGSAEGEYSRLASVYGRHPDVNQPWVESIYGRFSAGVFERALGIADFSDMPDAQLRALIVDHGYLPVTGRDSTLEERREAAEKQRELYAKPREELLKLAEELAGAYA